MTRSQRRARRQAQAASAEGQGSSATARAAQVRPQTPPKTQTGARRKEEKGGARRFIAECWGELKKVEWPTQSHVMQGTLVVIVACVIVGTFIWICDIISKNVVQDLILR